MMTIMSFIKKHPVLIYYVLTFVISWGCVFLVLSSTGSIPPSKEQADRLVPQIALGLVAGPSISGLLLTGLVDGRAGFRDLLSRLFRWRVGARWYAVALLTAPLSAAAVLLPLSLFSPEFLPAIVTTSDKAFLLLFGIGAGLVGAFCEELGWTGFAIPRLKLQYGVLATGLLMGFLWGLWHFPPFWEGNSFSGGFPLILLLGRLFSWLPAYRVLMIWVYDRTESLLLSILMHASLIASTLIIAPLATGLALLTWILVWAAALWVVVMAAYRQQTPFQKAGGTLPS